MTVETLIENLREKGWEFAGQGKRHDRWHHAFYEGVILVPRNASQDLSTTVGGHIKRVIDRVYKAAKERS